jgi:hypothetical protein
LRERPTGEAADEDGDAVEVEGAAEGERTAEGECTVTDDDTSDFDPTAAAIATTPTSTPAARRPCVRLRRVVARAGLLRVTPPLKAARGCRHVCDFRYAGDMRPL